MFGMDLRDDLPGIPVRRCNLCNALLCKPDPCLECAEKRLRALNRHAHLPLIGLLRERPMHCRILAIKLNVNHKTMQNRLRMLRIRGLVAYGQSDNKWRLT